ncbi:MAG: DUF2339 domain-containing protein [Planctomycetota bacterium]|nr:DUF2339 domain-containing protein [Planctomycetota bacterium]
MDLLGACIALGVLAFAGLGALMGWIAYVRIGKLERRLAHLEKADFEIRRDVHSSVVPGSRIDAARSSVAAASPVAQPYDRAPAGPPPTPPVVDAPASTLTAPAALAAVESTLSERAPDPTRTPPPIPTTVSRPEESAGTAAEAREPAAPFAAAPGSEPRPQPAAKSFDLERWLGVRGAAVLGGVFLAIAGFLFLQHAIERGWFTPRARVITATLGGLACCAWSFPLRRRGYTITANALAGASAVILYAASWAASMLYGFVSPLVSFAAMGLVTAGCVLVAWRHGTQLVAVLGLVGGFATPLVLSTGQDRPFGLFGYVLLLDLSFLFLAGKRRWPGIGLVALLGTTLIQGIWVVLRMDRDESWIGLGVLGVFALTFAGFATLRQPAERKSWILAQTSAVLLPFAFVLYFAQSFALAIPLGALALLAGLLCAAAGVLARRDETPWLPVGAAAGSIGLLFTWSVSRPTDFDASSAWLVSGCALGLALLQHAFAEWRRADGTVAPGAVAGAATAAVGALVLAVYAALDPGAALPWPWIACFAALALLLQRQAALADSIVLAWIGAGGAGFALALQRFGSLQELRPERDVAILAAIVGLGALLLAAAHRRASPARRGAFAAAAIYFGLATFAVWSTDFYREAFLPAHGLAVGAALVLAIGAVAAASGARSGACYFAAALVAFLTQAAHVGNPDAIAASPYWSTWLGLLSATTVLFAVWPFLTRAHWRDSTFAWCTAALQPLAWVFPIGALVEARYANTFAFATPLAFAVGTAMIARTQWRAAVQTEDGPREVQRRARIAATMVTLLFASSVVPIHVDREPVALTLALYAAALSAFWTRMDSRTVKWVAVASLVASLAWLALFSEPWSFPVPPRPIANVHAWLYLVPAACAVFAATRFGAHERERAGGFELGLVGSRSAIGAGIAGLAAVVLVFVWLNVEISARFAIGDVVGLHEPHEPGRALATSLGWASYALVLLGLGVARRSSGPRWASLVLFLATSAKVFLFDLGHLQGLQRAASMLGLALSLIVVSLVYQRFVFRRAPAPSDLPPNAGS